MAGGAAGGDNFIDDDFGLSNIRKESEQIRRQQLLIEQEVKKKLTNFCQYSSSYASHLFFQIDRIQQETKLAQSSSSVPSKPPPPYTPPASPSSKHIGTAGSHSPTPPPPPIKPEAEARLVPSEKDEVDRIVGAVAEEIFRARKEISEGETVDRERLIKVAERAVSSFRKKRSDGEEDKSWKTFLYFLCDLCAESSKEIFRCEVAEQNPPWLPQLPLAKERLGVPATASALSRRLRREASVLLGHERRSAREDLVVRWSQKKRDRVDQILVRELHSEEGAWTDYSRDEAAVKGATAEAVMAMLLEDTAREAVVAFAEKKHTQ